MIRTLIVVSNGIEVIMLPRSMPWLLLQGHLAEVRFGSELIISLWAIIQLWAI